MTQLDLKDYILLPEHKCYIYKTKEKEDGTYYFIRKNGGEKNNIAVLYPTKDNSSYTCGAACNICNQLDVPVPPYAKDIQVVIDDVKATAKKISPTSSKN